MQPIKIYSSHLKNVVEIFFGIIFAIASYYLGMSDWIINVWVLGATLLLYFCTPLFSLVALYSLIGLIFGRPIIIISDDGILDRSPFMNFGLIPWPEIDRVFYKRASNKDYICVALKKPETYLGGQSVLKRILTRKKASDDAFITFEQSLLPVKPGELIREIRSTHPEIRIHYPFPHFEKI
ncbi:MAG: STM3941 family protein [bacterium]|nr:STM3941 family protein [bacterium]